MKDILIVANYIVAPDETGNGRFNYIAKKLSLESNCNVELVSSVFSHYKKSKRKKDLNFKEYKLTLLQEPGYKKNISLKRFYSHWILSRNLKIYLKKRKKPDVIYCAVPTLSLAKVVTQYAKKNKIKLIIDIQDLWPEAFKMIFNPPIIGKYIYMPMEKKADYIYKNADEIIAVSETYVERGVKVNKKIKTGYSIFLGNDQEEYDKLKLNNNLFKNKNEFWLIYVGTLGHSYDLESVIKALKFLKETENILNIKFIVLGSGPLEVKFINYAKELKVNVEFLGRVEFKKVVQYLEKADLVINPIKPGSAASIINKVGDYAASGKAVVNTQESIEYRNLLNEYNAGINCELGSLKDLAEKIKYLYENKEIREKLGKNNRKMFEEKFDRKKTYGKIIELIEGD